MQAVIWFMLLFGHVHFDHGPYGAVAYVMPRDIAAGVGAIKGHLVYWFQTGP
jgi:hypothetical protein